MIPNRNAVIEMTIGLLVMAGAVQADPIFINTCPVVISSPGRYLLGADLICGGGDGITIASDDVTLALEGHRITAGVGANNAIVVTVGRNVHILGPGLITNGGGNAFLVGVSLGTSNDEVSGVTVLGSRNDGIFAIGCNSLTITANTLGRNNVGIHLVDVFFSTISENDASGNNVGMSLSDIDPGGTLGTVSHNIFNGNSIAGLSIIVVSSGAVFRNNVTNGNGIRGIEATADSSAEITNNTSLANGMNDLFVSAFPGTPPCGFNVWRDNTFFTANQSCIH
jgi:parallel beta-helix repeat protein